jgi:hypothetical protein
VGVVRVGGRDLWEEDWRGHGQGQLGLIQKLKRGGVVSGPLVG